MMAVDVDADNVDLCAQLFKSLLCLTKICESTHAKRGEEIRGSVFHISSTLLTLGRNITDFLEDAFLCTKPDLHKSKPVHIALKSDKENPMCKSCCAVRREVAFHQFQYAMMQ
jgi:hypothetical protein